MNKRIEIGDLIEIVGHSAHIGQVGLVTNKHLQWKRTTYYKVLLSGQTKSVTFQESVIKAIS